MNLFSGVLEQLQNYLFTDLLTLNHSRAALILIRMACVIPTPMVSKPVKFNISNLVGPNLQRDHKTKQMY